MLDRSSPFSLQRPPGPQSKNAVGLKRLRHALLTCEIEPGSAFAETELETRFELSRASIRVALASLAAEGLVTSRARQGWQAAPVTGELIGDLIAVRRKVEPLLLERVPGQPALEKLDTLAMMNAAVAGRDDPQSLVTARATDRQLLEILAGNSGHFLSKWLCEIWDHSARVIHFLENSEARFFTSNRRPLVKALAQHDRATATAEILLDIERFHQFVADALLRLRSPLAPMPGDNQARKMGRTSEGGTNALRPDSPARQNQTRGKTT